MNTKPTTISTLRRMSLRFQKMWQKETKNRLVSCFCRIQEIWAYFVGYYQWVPFILALQALCFFLPVVLWRAIYNSVGFRVRAICETCSIRANMDPSDRSKNVEIVARFLASDHQLAETLGGRVKHALQGRIVLFTYLASFRNSLILVNALFLVGEVHLRF